MAGRRKVAKVPGEGVDSPAAEPRPTEGVEVERDELAKDLPEDFDPDRVSDEFAKGKWVDVPETDEHPAGRVRVDPEEEADTAPAIPVPKLTRDRVPDEDFPDGLPVAPASFTGKPAGERDLRGGLPDVVSSGAIALVNPTPHVGDVGGPDTIPSRKYVVKRTAKVGVGGYITTVRAGTVVDERSHDVGSLRIQGVELEEI